MHTSYTIKDSFLGCILLKLAENGRELNKFFNLFTSKKCSEEWCATKKGGLQSRCTQTSEVLDGLFNGIDNIDMKLHNKPSANLLPGILGTSLKNPDGLVPIINSFEFEKIIRILREYNYREKIVNVKIGIPRSGEKGKGFPGHVFNILINQDSDNIHIFVCHSFIYSYNFKIFYTNDFNDLDKYLRNFILLFFKPRDFIFKASDETLYKYVFGADMVNYSLQNLSSIITQKPSVINVKLTESNFDILYESFNQCLLLLNDFKRTLAEISISQIDNYYKKIYCDGDVVPGTKIKIIKSFTNSLERLFKSLSANIVGKVKGCDLNDRYNELIDGLLPYSVQPTIQRQLRHVYPNIQ